jgi:Lysozyme inhibitor LprI
MMNALEPDQQAKLREMQRSWINTRDLTCAFWYDYFQGTMASPMIAYCNNREPPGARSSCGFLPRIDAHALNLESDGDVNAIELLVRGYYTLSPSILTRCPCRKLNLAGN